MSDLRVGIVGLGVMGRNHVRVLRALDGVTVVGVADPDASRHSAAEGLPTFPSVDGLLSLGLDMAVVAAPTALHLETGLALATSGVATLVEKPLATDTEQATRLVEAFEGAGVVNAVGHIERCNPALVAMRQRLEAGELGELYQVATRRQGPFPHRVADVGVVKDLATHDLDLAAWVLQSPYARVTAFTQHRSGREHEDLVAITGQTLDGTVANHLVNWLSPLKERCTVVTGERGALVADTLTGDLTFHENGSVATEWDRVSTFRGVTEGNSIRYALAKPEPLRVQHERFRDAVLGRGAGVVTMREGLAAVRVADACLRSAHDRQTVELEQE